MNPTDHDRTIAIGTKVEVTWHMTGHQRWYPAIVVNVTAKFVDIKRDDWQGGKPARYRRDTREGRLGYCGFKSIFRTI